MLTVTSWAGDVFTAFQIDNKSQFFYCATYGGWDVTRMGNADF